MKPMQGRISAEVFEVIRKAKTARCNVKLDTGEGSAGICMKRAQ